MTKFSLRAVLCISALCLLSSTAAAQSAKGKSAEIEKEIRGLDLEAAKAILNKDEKAIARFFTADSVTNNPRNGLTVGSSGVIEASKTGLINYYSFDRVAESVQVLGGTVVVMGNETIVLKNPEGGPGETIRRRYTNVWMKSGKNWQIVARHASIICR
jgi:ketosteroid isomerase-like protein